VKLTLDITGTNEDKAIVLEMAPMDFMPHSVHLFLELVSHQVWNNTVFWHQADIPHLVAATPINHSTGVSRKKDLQQMRLAGVSFLEHSKSYPHEKYTVGFSRHGPDFYINTMDNSKTHGPGGQAHYELDDEADPCFAKVVEGHDVVDTLLSLSLAEANNKREKLDWLDETLTQIVRAEIL
jgi:cyclophilin family peptidyl-prolyl cis-trans isomerase